MEFISHTQADPVLARHILQSENWDVKAAVQQFSVLRGASPFHHSGLVRSAPPNFKSSVKPPVAPKPVFDHKPISDLRHIADGRTSCGSKLAPLPPPRVRKVGQPKLHHDGQSAAPVSSHVLPPVDPSILPVANILVDPYHQKSTNSARVSSLPPIQKSSSSVNHSENSCHGSDFCSSLCMTSVATAIVPSINKYPSKPQSGSAKNALLIEKVRGTSASLLESQKNSAHEGTTRASSMPHNSANPSQITINSRCIISVNNPNNNANKNNNIYLDDYSPSSVNDSGTLSSASQTTNSVYNASLYSSPPFSTMQAASKDSSPYPSSAVPSATGPSSVIISSNTNSIDMYKKDSKVVRIIGVDAPKDYLCPPGSNEISDRETNCICDCQESRLPEQNANKEHELIDGDVLKSLKIGKKSIGDDEVDKVLRPEVASLTASGSGPSLSAPCSPAKPLLRKTEAVDLEEYDYYKKLSRGISKATDNVNIVSKARSEFAQEIWEAIDSSRTPFFIETPIFTFTLPDLSIYSDEFRLFLEKDLIETSTLVSLEGAGRLNWWALVGASQRLWPLATTGDGNCLLHAASLGMWGFHDRLLTLRKALHEFLTRSQFSRPLWRRWRWQVTQQNRETGLVYNDEEWETEWANVLRLASSAPRGGQDFSKEVCSDTSQKSKGQTNSKSMTDSSHESKRLSNGFRTSESEDCTGRVYESLEEIHVLALAHVLRRPIIVVADVTLKDVSGEPLAPIPFGGVYLPLECPPRECQRSPLLLTYDAAHFSALVVMETQVDGCASQLPAVIPLTDCCHELLPIQFVIDPGEDFIWGHDDQNPAVIQKLTITTHDKIGLLNEYLDVSQVPIPPGYLEACQAVDEAESPENYHPEIEKKSSESSFDSDEGPPYTDGTVGIFASKSKASKQLQTVAKQFGSIGKTMSKKIKKNFGTLSKLGRTGSFKKKDEYIKTCSMAKNSRMLKISTHQNYILAAMIHSEKRHAYQEEMVRNYLNTARRRFEKDIELRKRQEEEMKQLELEQLEHQAEMEGPVECINPGCNMYGTALTSYMCSACFAKQREQEQEYKRQTSSNLGSPKSQHFRADGPQYGAGRSKFYAELDSTSASDATKIPVIQALSSKKDSTLFLSNSTFYGDSSAVPSYNLVKSQSSVPTNDPSVEASDQLPGTDPSLQLSSSSITTTTMASQSSENFTPVAIDDVNVSVKGEDRSESPCQPCLTRDCKFYGSCSTSGYCSRCYQENSSINPKSVMVQQIKSVQL